MAITVQKPRPTVRTIRVKPVAGAASPSGEPAAETSAPTASAQASVPVTAAAPAAPAGRNPYTVFVIVGLAAVACFIALLVVQALEYSFYYQPESAFVREGAMPSAAHLPAR